MFEYDGLGWLPFCSGTLIGQRIFLTAGHCTSGEIPENIRVSFDEDPTSLPAGQLLEVEAVITHPQYYAWRPRSNNYDVGALILKQAVTGIVPATVADIGFLDELREAGLLRQGKEEAYFTVVGYGGTLIWPPPGILWEDKRKFAFSEYQALLKSWLLLSQNVATDDEIGGSCYGDSGGPIFWDTNGDILVAITSWGDMPTVATGICYRADTADTHDLIALAQAWLAP
jgi:secreted trypsin-like serine protease